MGIGIDYIEQVKNFVDAFKAIKQSGGNPASISAAFGRATWDLIGDIISDPAGDATIGNGALHMERQCRAAGGVVVFVTDANGVSTPTCKMPSDPVPDTVKFPVPVIPVSRPPIKIYEDPIYAPPDNPVFEIPARRIITGPTRAPVDPTPSRTKPAKTITVTKSLRDGERGCLLHEPITTSPVPFYVCNDTSFEDEIGDKQGEAAGDFLTGLLADAGEIVLDAVEQNKRSLCSMGLSLITRRMLPGVVQGVALFGCEAIVDLTTNYIKRNAQTFFPVSGLIPINFEFIECPPPVTYTDGVTANLDINNVFNVDLAPVLNAVNNIEANLSVDLSPVLNAIANIDISPTLNIDFSSILDALVNVENTIQLEASFTISTILNAIANLDVNIDLSPAIDAIVNVENNLNLNFGNIENTLEVNFGNIEIQLGGIEDCCEELVPHWEGSETYVEKCGEDGIIHSFDYNGKAFNVLLDWLIFLYQRTENLREIICDAAEVEPNCFPLFPGEQFTEFEVPTQLSLTFGQDYPKSTGSLWHMGVPNPLHWSELDWCTHFDPMIRQLGEYQGRVYAEGSKMWVGGYAESRESITEFLTTCILPLSTLPFEKLPNGDLRIRTTGQGNAKRIPDNRTVRCIRAVWVETDPTTNKVIDMRCFYPPRGGCQ